MAFRAQGAPSIVESWTKGKLNYFMMSKSGGHCMASYYVPALGKKISMMVGWPIETNKLNKIRVAAGMPAVEDAEGLMLPDYEDKDKLGYDVWVDVFITQDGQYYNVEDVRPQDKQAQGTTQFPSSKGSQFPTAGQTPAPAPFPSAPAQSAAGLVPAEAGFPEQDGDLPF